MVAVDKRFDLHLARGTFINMGKLSRVRIEKSLKPTWAGFSPLSSAIQLLHWVWLVRVNKPLTSELAPQPGVTGSGVAARLSGSTNKIRNKRRFHLIIKL